MYSEIMKKLVLEAQIRNGVALFIDKMLDRISELPKPVSFDDVMDVMVELITEQQQEDEIAKSTVAIARAAHRAAANKVTEKDINDMTKAGFFK